MVSTTAVAAYPCRLPTTFLLTQEVWTSPSTAKCLPRRVLRSRKVVCEGGGERATSTGRQYANSPKQSSSSISSTNVNQEKSSSTENGSSVQSHLDLLEQLTSESPRNAGTPKTIAQQLAEELPEALPEEVVVPLGSNKLEMEPLTISQKRNIRRQNYLNQVSKRNDVPFFTTVFLFVFIPPVAILGVAVATGYIDLFP